MCHARPMAWESTPQGRHLRGRRKTDTTPEVALRRALHAAGARFRLQPLLARGCRPDLVLPGRRLAVFVDGCFWHSCPVHGRKTPFAGPNAALWEEKMARNIERDRRAVEIGRELGWTVVRLWECDVMANPAAAADEVLAHAASGQRRGRQPPAG